METSSNSNHVDGVDKNKMIRLTHISHNESKDVLDGLALALSCNNGEDTQTDNIREITEITPPKPSKYELLTPMLNR